MKPYHALLREILDNGARQPNRTGIDAISMPGAMMKFDLREGFPVVTTKRLAFKAVVGELLGFLRGVDNAADFRALGCNVWNQNANENAAWLANPHRRGEDDLGRIYGVQWRGWRGADGVVIDQVSNAVRTILSNPYDRRIIINAWKPDELGQMALPPCHVLYQFLCNPERKELHLTMYQRSADAFLGVPFNTTSCAMFLHIMARLTGYTPATFTHFLADAHVYVNHREQVEELLSRDPRPLPELRIAETVPSFASAEDFDPSVFDQLHPGQFSLEGYDPHPAIKADMAV